MKMNTLFVLFALFTCPVLGQVKQKQNLTSTDYHLWGNLTLEKISSDGQWASYSMSYENNIDTLFVRNTNTHKTFAFSSVQSSVFTKNNSFVCLNQQGLHILALNTGKKLQINAVNKFVYSALADVVIMTVSSPNETNKLVIQSPDGKIDREITDVTNFSLSPDQRYLVYETSLNKKQSVILVDLKKTQQEKRLLVNCDDESFGFTWHKEGKAVAFATKSGELVKNKLYFYAMSNDRLFELEPAMLSKLAKNTFIPTDHTLKLTISDDIQKVFFTTKINQKTDQNTNSSDVEIWNGNDKSLYAEREKNGAPGLAPKVALWIPVSNFTAQITTNDLPDLMLSGDQRYAFLFNNKQYEPQFKLEEAHSDIYVMNLKTFEKKLLLKEHSTHFLDLIPSPKGKYISYFRDGNWWAYNISADTHHNITANIKVKFTAHDFANISAINGNAGWSIDDKEILLYDEFDLWAIKPNGTSARRLTHGREFNIQYRLAIKPGRQRLILTYKALKIDSFDLDKELFFHGQGDDGKTGYFKWNKKSGEKAIVYDDRYIDQLVYTDDKNNLFYREQKFDRSPQIIVKKNHFRGSSLFESNPQQKNYHWGRSQLIDFQNGKGKKMKGVLRYPANYDPQKKYPMIVIVYEKQYKKLHKYVNPTFADDGENDIIWTTQDYFVLRPDVVIEDDEPGISAADCVTAAVKKVISMNIVKQDKIGLMGFSFGGYETAFISTQSDLFAAAIAGSGSTDLNSFYFTLAKDFSYPNLYRFFDGQWKMTKTPFEAPEAYQRNSAVVNADKVTTPMLIWTGKEDNNIDPHQSMEFYFALRSLGKQCIMLLYPEEGHGLSKSINQKDITDRTQQWFAFYLKDEKPANWIANGIE
jgi:dipeptidyl aminopeptidase/acylaminoacyl peptidase